MTPFVRECNWLQALEGDIDSAHSSFLHSVLQKDDINNLGTGLKHVDRHPRFEVLDTDFGVTIAARRTPEDETLYYWRLTQFLFPIVTYFPPTGEQMETVPGHIWIPLDDATTLVWTLRWHPQKDLNSNDPASRQSIGRQQGGAFESTEEYLPATTGPAGRWRWVANRSNDYLLDYDAQQSRRFSGIPTIPSTGSSDDREHGDGDEPHNRAPWIDGRRDYPCTPGLAQAARALREDGATPPGVDRPEVFRVRSASGLLPKDAVWIDGTAPWVRAEPSIPVVSA